MDQESFINSLHANGKIYPVIAVISVILVGLIIYLISIDRKLNRLEKEAKSKQ